MEDWLGRTTFAYDAANQVIRVDDVHSESIDYAYDAIGQRCLHGRP